MEDNKDKDPSAATSPATDASADTGTPITVNTGTSSASPAGGGSAMDIMPAASTPASPAADAAATPEAPASDTSSTDAASSVDSSSASSSVSATDEAIAAASATVTPSVMGGDSTASKSGGDKKSSPIRLVLEILLVVLIVALGAYSYTLMQDNSKLKDQVTAYNNNPVIKAQKETDALIAKVSKLTQLPKGETPTVAVVSDAAAAKKQQAFFAKAENGDKVLIYVKGGEAVLYRPSTGKIVLVAPINLSGTPSTATTTTTTTPAATTTPATTTKTN